MPGEETDLKPGCQGYCWQNCWRYCPGAIKTSVEPWGFEPQISPCHGDVIPFHYGPADRSGALRGAREFKTLAARGLVSSGRACGDRLGWRGAISSRDGSGLQL